jgi:hypothetical protein
MIHDTALHIRALPAMSVNVRQYHYHHYHSYYDYFHYLLLLLDKHFFKYDHMLQHCNISKNINTTYSKQK